MRRIDKPVMRILLTALLACAMTGCETTQRASTRQAVYRPNVDADADTYQGGVLLAPSANPNNTAQHIVGSGETLWSIAKAYNVNLNDLTAVNSIHDTTAIAPGQTLIIPRGQIRPRRQAGPAYVGKAVFLWPVKGSIASRFGDKAGKGTNKGIDIRAARGSDVAASRNGRVVYCDSRLKGFGQTVIIDHLDYYQTVYSYNSDILVKVGDTVRQNQVIARVGSSGRAQEPMLHFEIRKNGEPVDPARYIIR